VAAGSAYSAAVRDEFAAWLPRTIGSALARRISSENSCERFEKKLVLCGGVIRRLLQETSNRWSDRDKANLRFHLAAMCRFIERPQGFFNFCVALDTLPQH